MMYRRPSRGHASIFYLHRPQLRPSRVFGQRFCTDLNARRLKLRQDKHLSIEHVDSLWYSQSDIPRSNYNTTVFPLNFILNNLYYYLPIQSGQPYTAHLHTLLPQVKTPLSPAITCKPNPQPSP